MDYFLNLFPSKAPEAQDADVQVKEKIVKEISRGICKDPAADLTETLNQAAKFYPIIREMCNDTVVSPGHAVDDSEDEADMLASWTTTEEPWHTIEAPWDAMERFQIPDNAVALRPFSDELLQLANKRHSGKGAANPKATTAVIKILNQAVLEGEVIWKSESPLFLSKTIVSLPLPASGPELVMKVGRDVDLDHLCTMEYIKNAAPAVPIPEIHGALEVPNSNLKFIIMSRAPGQPLSTLWDTLDIEQKKAIQKKLDSHMIRLRHITPPPVTEENAVLGGGEPRRCKKPGPIRIEKEPIANEKQFNSWLTAHRRKSFYSEMIQSFMDTEHELVMTHGDLNPRHVMVVPQVSSTAEPLRISAILDWEMCGLYPEYWEYIKALSGIAPNPELEDWWYYLPKVLGNWPLEYAVDKLISKWEFLSDE